MEKIRMETQADGIYDITEIVREAIARTGDKTKLCTVVSLQSAAGVFLSEAEAGQDIQEELRNMAPARYNYRGKRTTPAHTAGVIKAAITGNAVTLAVEGGRLLLGEKTRILLAEFDGPRVREYVIQSL